MSTQEPTPTRLFEVAKAEGYADIYVLAKALGVHAATLWRIQRGQRRIGLAVRQKATDLFPTYPRQYLFPDEMPKREAS